MKKKIKHALWIIPLAVVLFGAMPAGASVFVQCPGDMDGDLKPDPVIPAGYTNAGDPNPGYDPDVVCMHIVGADGFTVMADGYDQYVFGFGLVASSEHPAVVDASDVIPVYSLKAESPAPIIVLNEGQELYLTLTNVGMVIRPDLFDPHSVHYHGFPNAAPIFDGLPEPSPTPIMGASLTYYYKAVVPGNFFYHCHVEASEHMQMGMIGNAWIHPAQNGTQYTLQDGTGRTFIRFVYNDGDGRTGYDKEYPFQMTGFDSRFHDASLNVGPLPFADMYDNYPMINGRGYPDTVNPNPITNRATLYGGDVDFDAQITPTLIEAIEGQRILLRVSNVSSTHIYSIANTLGVPFHVVGRGAAQLIGPDGKDLTMKLNVLNVGGGQAFDVILDTYGVAPGTYFIYTTDLSNLANGLENVGGIMTEVVVSASN